MKLLVKETKALEAINIYNLSILTLILICNVHQKLNSI